MVMGYAKTGYIHVLKTEGKLFLKCGDELVLTLLHDYVSNFFLDLTAFSPVCFQGGFF